MDGMIETAYGLACRLTNQPLFGAWKGGDGEYVDVVVLIAFNSEDGTKRVGKRYDQQTIIRINPDGNAESIQTD